MNYLPLCLSGVLQYFSDTNMTALRITYNTSLYPTKQAIIGLIASALGYNRGDIRSTELFNMLDVKYAVVKDPIILEDFQTIKGLKSQRNYMNKFYTRNKFTTVCGSIQENRQLTKNVQYLQNAEFMVYIGCDDAKLKEIYNALRNPVYSLYIGKRSCIPNKPIVTDFTLIKKEDLSDAYDCA